MNDRFGKQAKRLLCGLLAFVVLAGYLPDLSVFAADAQAPADPAVTESPAPETTEPTEEPTAEPTEEPTEEPTAEPTAAPTAAPTEEPAAEPAAPPEPGCTCTEKCAEDKPNSDCPVCAAEGADLAACKGEGKQEPQCSCAAAEGEAHQKGCPLYDALAAFKAAFEELAGIQQAYLNDEAAEEELDAAYAAAAEAYKALTDEQKAALPEEVRGAMEPQPAALVEDTSAAAGITTEEALREAVEKGGEIKLDGNITLANTLTIEAGAAVILDLAGHTLSGPQAGNVLVNEGTLVIRDSAGGGTITRDEPEGKHKHGYIIVNNGALTLEGGLIEGKCTRGNPPSTIINGPQSDATLAISGGRVYAELGIAVKNDDHGTLTMTGGEVTSNSAAHGHNYAAIQNWTMHATVSGGTINGEVQTWTYDNTNAKTVLGGSVAVHGGVYTLKYKDKAANEPQTEITGGSFDADVRKYVAEGYKQDPSGKVIEGTDGPSYGDVALVGNAGYASLQDAISAAKPGDTVTLLRDIAVNGTKTGSESWTKGIVVNKNITLDLGGKTITSNEDCTFCIWVNGGAALTVCNGTIDSSAAEYGLFANSNGAVTTQNITVTAQKSAVRSFGAVTVNEGSSLAGGSYGGIFLLDSGSVTVNGGTVTGTSYGIDMAGGQSETAAGSVIVNGGTVKGQTVGIRATARDDVKVAGGTVEGGKTGILVEGGSLAVTAGSVNGPVDVDKAKTVAITGGTFDTDVTGYLDPNQYKQDTDGKVQPSKDLPVGRSDVAEVDGFGYPTIAEAVKAAKKGDTVTLLKDVTLGKDAVTINKDLSLDLNGHTITASETNNTCFNVTGRTAFYVYNGGAIHGNAYTFQVSESSEVLIEDTTVTGTGTAFWNRGSITFGKDSNVYGGSFSGVFLVYGTVTVLDGATVSGNGYGIGMTGNADPKLPKKVTIEGGTVTGTVAGVCVQAGDAVISGGTVKGAKDGIQIKDNGNLTVENGSISGVGNGISVAGNGSSLAISGGSVDGGIKAENGTVAISGGSYSVVPQPEYVVSGLESYTGSDGRFYIRSITPAPTQAPAAGGGTPAAPAAGPTAVPVAVPAPAPAARPAAPAAVELEEPDTPLAGPSASPAPSASSAPSATPAPGVEDLGEEDTPLAGPAGSSWALINLLLALATLAGGALALAGAFGRRGSMRAVSAVPALGAVIAFLLTERLGSPMVLTDRWTLLMAAIALAQLAVCLVARRQNQDTDAAA